MNATGNAGEPGSAAPGGSTLHDGRNASGDSYSDHYADHDRAPDLDAGAPDLRTRDMRRLNRRAIGFLAAIVLLLVALSFVLLRTATHPKQPPKPRAETVVVPQVPPLPPRPAAAQAVAPPPAVPMPAAAPIAPATPLPVLPVIQPPGDPAARGPTLLERRLMAAQGAGQLDAAGTPPGAPPTDATMRSGRRVGATSASYLSKQDTLLMQGTIIRCVLQTRIISDIPGFSSCVVTDPVYSFDGRHTLLPKGSKVFGRYDSGPVGPRIAVIWNRVVTPTGIDVDMASPGVDNLGGSGLPGSLDSHWRSRIGAALLISLMSDAFLYEGEKHGPRTDNISPGGGFVVQSPFQSNTAQTLQELSRQAVRSSANRRATLTINQGSVISIYVARDVDFSGVMARL